MAYGIKNKGRRGDTEIRQVHGEISHVNAFEAYLIDKYGTLGEDITAIVGSGTINPRTGLREHSLLYSEDTGWFWEDDDYLTETGQMKKEAGEAVTIGVEGIKGQMGQMMGLGGIFAKQAKARKATSLGQAGQVAGQMDIQAGKTGFASSGAIESMGMEAQRQLSAQEGVAIAKEQAEKTDFLARMREKVNTLITGYHTATGEGYGDTDEIYDIFDEYE